MLFPWQKRICSILYQSFPLQREGWRGRCLQCWTALPRQLSLRASPLPKVHGSYFIHQTRKISAAMKPKFTLQLELTLKNDWSCQSCVGLKGIFSPKDPCISVPAFLPHSLFSTFRKRTSKQASSYHRSPKTESWSMSDSYLSQWLFWGSFNHFPFLEKRQTCYVLKSLSINGPWFWDVVISSVPRRTFLPSHISVVHVPCQLLPNWPTCGPGQGSYAIIYMAEGW